jgi:hypothetical protein
VRRRGRLGGRLAARGRPEGRSRGGRDSRDHRRPRCDPAVVVLAKLAKAALAVRAGEDPAPARRNLGGDGDPCVAARVAVRLEPVDLAAPTQTWIGVPELAVYGQEVERLRAARPAPTNVRDLVANAKPRPGLERGGRRRDRGDLQVRPVSASDVGIGRRYRAEPNRQSRRRHDDGVASTSVDHFCCSVSGGTPVPIGQTYARECHSGSERPLPAPLALAKGRAASSRTNVRLRREPGRRAGRQGALAAASH